MKASACKVQPQELMSRDQKYKPFRRLKVYRIRRSSSMVYAHAIAVPAARIQYSTGL